MKQKTNFAYVLASIASVLYLTLELTCGITGAFTMFCCGFNLFLLLINSDFGKVKYSVIYILVNIAAVFMMLVDILIK
jgi:hypothetical protein